MIEKLFNKLGYIKISKHNEQTNYLRECLATKFEELSKTNSEIEKKNLYISYLKKEIKELKRKNSVLLTKQGKLKRQITIEESKSLFWKKYADNLGNKLEYLCFGSILPHSLRTIDLSKYKHIRKEIEATWYTDKEQNVGVKVNEST